MPWVIEPTTVIYLTTGKSLYDREILLSKGSMSAGIDLYYEPFRWGHKFVAFLIQPHVSSTASSGSNTSPLETPGELLALAEATGGDVIVCRGLSKAIANMKKIVHSI